MKTVTYYTHEGSDANHSTRDTVALVLAENEETGWADLAVFPVGGPVTFCRAYAWNDDAPLPPPGGNYWRDEGSDPPDFGNAYRHYTDERFQNLLRKQQQELVTAPAKNHVALHETHKKEQDDLLGELDGDAKAEPAPKAEPEKEKVKTASDLHNEQTFGGATDMGRRA